MSHDDFTPEDPLPALLAAIDQMLAMVPQVARAAFVTFEAFKAEGFSDSHALYLTAVQLKDHPGQAP